MNALTRCLLALLLASTLGAASAAVFEPREFRSADEQARYKQLVDELRCLVCQNQNIADSDADLAKDLRDRVHRMINEGKSDREIVDYMVARYGDFVLYRPPLTATTLALWAGPFLLVIVGLAALLRRLRGNDAAALSPSAALSEADSARAKALLERGPDATPPC